eukprot:Rhum_TRINITY_DN13594_c1_g1::Rhum_TRINITY_DN13594_c1_g1_i1::g.61682::m.61682
MRVERSSRTSPPQPSTPLSPADVARAVDLSVCQDFISFFVLLLRIYDIEAQRAVSLELRRLTPLHQRRGRELHIGSLVPEVASNQRECVGAHVARHGQVQVRALSLRRQVGRRHELLVLVEVHVRLRHQQRHRGAHGVVRTLDAAQLTARGDVSRRLVSDGRLGAADVRAAVELRDAVLHGSHSDNSQTQVVLHQDLHLEHTRPRELRQRQGAHERAPPGGHLAAARRVVVRHAELLGEHVEAERVSLPVPAEVALGTAAHDEWRDSDVALRVLDADAEVRRRLCDERLAVRAGRAQLLDLHEEVARGLQHVGRAAVAERGAQDERREL